MARRVVYWVWDKGRLKTALVQRSAGLVRGSLSLGKLFRTLGAFAYDLRNYALGEAWKRPSLGLPFHRLEKGIKAFFKTAPVKKVAIHIPIRRANSKFGPEAIQPIKDGLHDRFYFGARYPINNQLV